MEEEFLVEDLEIDAKVKKVLKKIGIKNIGDFENINIRKIKKLNDLGEKYIQQLENALYDLGVDLMEDEEIINQCKRWRQNQALNIDYINNTESIEKILKKENKTNKKNREQEERVK